MIRIGGRKKFNLLFLILLGIIKSVFTVSFNFQFQYIKSPHKKQIHILIIVNVGANKRNYHSAINFTLVNFSEKNH